MKDLLQSNSSSSSLSGDQQTIFFVLLFFYISGSTVLFNSALSSKNTLHQQCNKTGFIYKNEIK